jgi:hypothetical protein
LEGSKRLLDSRSESHGSTSVSFELHKAD